MGSATQPSFHDLEQTAIVLANGFETLLSEVEYLARREQCLKEKLDFAHEAYRELTLNPTLAAGDSTKPSDILGRIKADEEPSLHIKRPLAKLDQVAGSCNLTKAFESCKKLNRERRQRNGDQRGENFTDQRPVNGAQLEHDFTTRNGTPGNLDCPFANPVNDNEHIKPATADPIAAELHHEGSVGTGTAYALQNPNKCPIRYLDQHSPEEVAKYFENHKHEIPRSHALCVSRYQQNDAKIRQLDAKYGNLQDMIQRLGEQHQQYLPAKKARDGDDEQPRSVQLGVVEKWAEKASHGIEFGETATPPPSTGNQPRETPAGDDGEAHGQGPTRFEKPLREIRVGESPSRPWGISVPIAQQAAASAQMSEKGIEPLSLDEHGGSNVPTPHNQPQHHRKPAGKCPLGGTKDKQWLDDTGKQAGRAVHDSQEKTASYSPRSPHPHMIFNGPVFFGYPAEQVRAMMQAGTFGGPAQG